MKMPITPLYTSSQTTEVAKALDVDPFVTEIIATIAAEFGIDPQRMMSQCRSHDVWMPRMLAMYFARLLTNTPLVVLGETFGGRSHTTVLRAFRRCRSMIEGDEAWARRVNGLLTRLMDQSFKVRAA
jgi:chromosomal replication initiation ATPase DnaA